MPDVLVACPDCGEMVAAPALGGHVCDPNRPAEPEPVEAETCPWCHQTFYALPGHDALKPHIDYCPDRPAEPADGTRPNLLRHHHKESAVGGPDRNAHGDRGALRKCAGKAGCCHAERAGLARWLSDRSGPPSSILVKF